MKKCFVIYLSLLLCPDSAFSKSEFNKKIDLDRLNEAYADKEDEDWHEDSYTWNQEQRKKRAKLVGKDPSKMTKTEIETYRAASQGMKMGFLKLRDSWCGKPKCDNAITDDLGKRYGAILKTGGIKVMTTVVEPNTLLFVESEGRMDDVKKFVLDQKESWTWRVDSTTDIVPGLAPPSREFKQNQTKKPAKTNNKKNKKLKATKKRKKLKKRAKSEL